MRRPASVRRMKAVRHAVWCANCWADGILSAVLCDEGKFHFARVSHDWSREETRNEE